MLSTKHFPITVCFVILFLALSVSNLQTSSAQEGVWDGRINECAHLGPAVIYCFDPSGNTSPNNTGGGGIKIVAPVNSVDFEALIVTQAEINAVGIPTDGPVLIKAGGEELGVDYKLWRLPDGKFMLTGVDEHGKPFQFIWTGCQAQRCTATPEIIPLPPASEPVCIPDIEADFDCYCLFNPQDSDCNPD